VPSASQDNIGRYRLLRCLREGKICQVWEAVDDRDGKHYAIKRLPAGSDKRELAFLKHEFAVGSKLISPRVIQLYELGSSHGEHFMVMELCAIQNLKQVLLLGVEQIAPVVDKIMVQCAEGLACLHKTGWVHRDVKPDNFLIKADGDIKLIDFALAAKITKGFSKIFARGAKQVQGTRSYMSPEQIRCKPLDARADVYSFGCVCYELATGKVPFTGTTTAELLNKHLRNPAPPMASMNGNVSDEFSRLGQRMLAKLPEQRPASMEEFIVELRGMRIFKQLPKMVADDA
jgi:serine/threonine protein kinase